MKRKLTKVNFELINPYKLAKRSKKYCNLMI